MLLEALKYLGARLSGQADPHGHLAQQVALWARHRRKRQDWEPHLAHCRELILAAASACPQQTRRTALILGSGLLLEVPLAELSALFGRVVLADMAFVPPVRRLARRLGNVALLETDLTGCLDRLPDLTAAQDIPEPDLSCGLPDLDFVCSANLLSQLPLFVLPGVLRLAQGEAQRTALAAALVQRHLEALRQLPCPVCLITDLWERGRKGDAVDCETDLLFGVDPGLSGQRWVWSLALRGEAVRGLDVERLVLGVPDIRSAAQTGPDPACAVTLPTARTA